MNLKGWNILINILKFLDAIPLRDEFWKVVFSSGIYQYWAEQPSLANWTFIYFDNCTMNELFASFIFQNNILEKNNKHFSLLGIALNFYKFNDALMRYLLPLQTQTPTKLIHVSVSY